MLHGFFFSIFPNLCMRYAYVHMHTRICTCHAPCAMDLSPLSAMDSSAMDSSAMDSSAMESSSVDSSAMESSSVDSSAVDSSARKAALAKEEKGFETVALVRVLNKGRLDSLGADLLIEKEQGVAGRRLRRKGKLD